MSDSPATDSSQADSKNRMMSILGALGSLLLFLFILFVTYLPQRDQDPLARTTEQRLEYLREVETTAAREMTSLEVADPTNQTYKIPVDRAMELTIQEYKEKRQ